MSHFPRAEAMLEASATADMLRRKADELDVLAAAAHETEPGTLRRKLRAVSIEVAFSLGGES